MNDETTATAESTDLVAQLSSNTPDGRARQMALSATQLARTTPTSLVEYRSGGELLIIDQFRSVGEEERAVNAANALSDQLRCTVFIGGLAPTGTTERIAAWEFEPISAANSGGRVPAVPDPTKLGHCALGE